MYREELDASGSKMLLAARHGADIDKCHLNGQVRRHPRLSCLACVVVVVHHKWTVSYQAGCNSLTL